MVIDTIILRNKIESRLWSIGEVASVTYSYHEEYQELGWRAPLVKSPPRHTTKQHDKKGGETER